MTDLLPNVICVFFFPTATPCLKHVAVNQGILLGMYKQCYRPNPFIVPLTSLHLLKRTKKEREQRTDIVRKMIAIRNQHIIITYTFCPI